MKTRRFLDHDLNSFVATHQQLDSKIEISSMSADQIESFAAENNLQSAFDDASPAVGIRHASTIKG